MLLFIICYYNQSNAQLEVGFYKNSCPRAESIIRDKVQRSFFLARGIAPGILRLHFHDCFVRVIYQCSPFNFFFLLATKLMLDCLGLWWIDFDWFNGNEFDRERWTPKCEQSKRAWYYWKSQIQNWSNMQRSRLLCWYSSLCS